MASTYLHALSNKISQYAPPGMHMCRCLPRQLHKREYDAKLVIASMNNKSSIQIKVNCIIYMLIRGQIPCYEYAR